METQLTTDALHQATPSQRGNSVNTDRTTTSAKHVILHGSLNDSFGNGSFNGAIAPTLPIPGSTGSGWEGEFGFDVNGNRGFKETGSNGKEWLNLGVPSDDHFLFNHEPVVERYTNGVRDEPTNSHKRRPRRRRRPSPPPPLIPPPPQYPPPPPPPLLPKARSADALLQSVTTFSPTAADLNLHDRHFFPKTYTEERLQAVLAGNHPIGLTPRMGTDSPTYAALATMVERLSESGSDEEIRKISPAEW
ncbi:hypothetical protein CA3LBN_003235 [Candidozyma haemuli]|uniref:Uncharacterized protein n=1 Tax=Candidozyma haemuli TaxID=45357 RepID=A0ABX8I7A4_9ASCO|nr:hypothetical protein CA3LBN_003235 [[Candida] haemuloni]